MHLPSFCFLYNRLFILWRDEPGHWDFSMCCLLLHSINEDLAQSSESPSELCSWHWIVFLQAANLYEKYQKAQYPEKKNTRHELNMLGSKKLQPLRASLIFFRIGGLGYFLQAYFTSSYLAYIFFNIFDCLQWYFWWFLPVWCNIYL